MRDYWLTQEILRGIGLAYITVSLVVLACHSAKAILGDSTVEANGAVRTVFNRQWTGHINEQAANDSDWRMTA